MSTNSAQPSPELPRDARKSIRAVLLGGSIVWLVGFNLCFYSLSLPNNDRIPRLRVWQELPYYLMLLPPEDAPPSGWSYLAQRFDLLLVAAIILAGAWGWGHLVLRLTRAALPRRCAERTVLAFGLGLSALSLLTLGCGLMGLLSRWLLGGLIVAAAVVELAVRAGWLGSNAVSPQSGDVGDGSRTFNVSTLPQPSPGREGSSRRAPAFIKWACLVAIVPFAMAIVLGSMLPSTDFDVNEYHLEGPKEFFLNGRVSMLPHNVYTSFPFLTEMLSLLAMVLRGDWFRGALAGQAVLMTFAPLTALGLYAAGRRWFSPAAGWLAALVYLSTPWTFRISTIAYAEGGLSFFLFASLLATMLAIEQLSNDRRTGGSILLAGMLAGSAMACKYPGVLSVVIPMGAALVAAPFFLGFPRAESIRVGGRAAVCFALGVLLTIGPWLAKNAFETSNPVYPLLYSVFEGKDWDAELNAKWKKAHSPDDYDLGKIPAWMRDVSAQNDWLSPLLYGFAPLALIMAGRRRMPKLLWLYVGYLFVTWWAFTHRLDRFWVPMIPVAALLAGVGAASWKGTVWKFASGVCIVAALLFNLGIVVSGMAGNDQFLVDLDYARDWTANLTAPNIAYLNREFRAGELPKDSTVLCVGEAQVFDAEFPVVYNTVFDYSIFEQWTADDRLPMASGDRAMRDPTEIRQKFRDERIRILLVNWQEIVRYRTTYGYTDYVTPPRFKQLEQARVLMQPLTFASLVLPDLGDDEFASKRKEWKPGPYQLQDGRTVYIGSVRKPLDEREADEIARWAPSLFGQTKQGRVLITSQIYRVAE